MAHFGVLPDPLSRRPRRCDIARGSSGREGRSDIVHCRHYDVLLGPLSSRRLRRCSLDRGASGREGRRRNVSINSSEGEKSFITMHAYSKSTMAYCLLQPDRTTTYCQGVPHKAMDVEPAGSFFRARAGQYQIAGRRMYDVVVVTYALLAVS